MKQSERIRAIAKRLRRDQGLEKAQLEDIAIQVEGFEQYCERFEALVNRLETALAEYSL